MKFKLKWLISKKFMGLFIIIIMVVSTAGFVLFQGGSGGLQSNEVEYNGFIFYQTQSGGYFTRVNNQRYTFRNLPIQLEDIEMGQLNPANRVYFIHDPSDEEVDNDYFYRRFGSFLQFNGITPQQACYTEENCTNIPIRNCKDDFSMIYLKSGNITKGYNEDNCLILEIYDDFDIDRVVERLIYQYLGIME